jgi:hypothetical protein
MSKTTCKRSFLIRLLTFLLMNTTPVDSIVLRLYPRTESSGRELIHTICLSYGLVQPKDSRNCIIDVLLILFPAQKQEQWLTSKQIHEQVITYRTEQKIKLDGTAESNIRRILKQLLDIGVVERKTAKYRILEWNDPAEVFDTMYRNHTERILLRNKEFLKRI